jgi:hypothetical protein
MGRIGQELGDRVDRQAGRLRRDRRGRTVAAPGAAARGLAPPPPTARDAPKPTTRPSTSITAIAAGPRHVTG